MRTHWARPTPAPPSPPPEELAAELAAELNPEPARPDYGSFEEIEKLFPRDTMGNVDWVAAVEAGLAAPRPGIDPDTPDLPPMPLDVRLDPGIPGMEVVFPHEQHTYWLRCDNCHPAIFQMKAGADPIKMADIFLGRYCGVCHGKVSFAPATGCPRCHVGMRGGA